MRAMVAVVLAVAVGAGWAGCSGEVAGAHDGGPADGAADLDAEAPDGPAPDAGADGPAPCPEGVTCVDTFPFGEDRDTSLEPPSRLEGYSCSDADEGGPEVIYRVTVPEAGFLSAAVDEQPGVDVDVHILGALDPATCLDRGNFHARADVQAGDYYVVVDTFVSSGTPQAGAFHVDLGFVVPSQGPCAMEAGVMPRVGDGGNSLPMPATGPMVMEAHLVTQEEPPPYPTTATEHLAEHYDLSQGRTGFVLHRTQKWAPLEGGSFYGCGIGSPTDFPVLHEAWYVNMYWTSAARPAKGTRMILRDAAGGGRAVVVAAGYETGPGDLTHVGGTPEESHFYLGTTHLGPMQIGIAVDQSLPLGPRVCAD